MKGKHFRKTKKNKVTNRLILIISIAIFLCCLAILLYWLNSTRELENIEEDLYTEVLDINSDKQEEDILTIDFEKLKQINSDVIGWIRIKNTDINYPILQATDNEYYLKRSLYQNYSSCGSIFLDCNTKSDFSEQNSVIYGHNLKNQKMFADLAKIYKGELGNKVQVEIYTENSFQSYTIFACYMEEPNIEVIQKNWSQEDKTSFINKALEKSNINFSCDIEYTNNILTLITCDSTGKKRIIVHAI